MTSCGTFGMFASSAREHETFATALGDSLADFGLSCSFDTLRSDGESLYRSCGGAFLLLGEQPTKVAARLRQVAVVKRPLLLGGIWKEVDGDEVARVGADDALVLSGGTEHVASELARRLGRKRVSSPASRMADVVEMDDVSRNLKQILFDVPTSYPDGTTYFAGLGRLSGVGSHLMLVLDERSFRSTSRRGFDLVADDFSSVH